MVCLALRVVSTLKMKKEKDKASILDRGLYNLDGWCSW